MGEEIARGRKDMEVTAGESGGRTKQEEKRSRTSKVRKVTKRR